MAFIYEKVTPEQSDELLNRYTMTNTQGEEVPATRSYWAIDHDKNAFILEVGTDYSARNDQPPITYLVLFWNDQRIYIQFYWERDMEKRVFTRCVKRILAPDTLMSKKLELEDLIKEAIIAYNGETEPATFRYRQLSEPEFDYKEGMKWYQ
jgi:hypothetical protein